MPLLKNHWNSHDFKVKMLDWTASRGSRLAYTCRWCGRGFCRFALQDPTAWAIDGSGRALEDGISDRWLSEGCPRTFNAGDNDDRGKLSRPMAQ